jgi:peroxiredoxin
MLLLTFLLACAADPADPAVPADTLPAEDPGVDEPPLDTDAPPADTDAPPADPPADTDAAPTDTDPPVEPPPPPCAGRTSGTALTECAPDFTLFDADGVAWSVYDHVGDVIVLDFSAMWCPHCQNLADDLEALHLELSAQGLTVATVLTEDLSSNPPDAADLRSWSSTLGVTHAVLADPGAVIEATWGGYYQPNVVVIGRDLTITWRSTGSTATAGLDAAVRGAL